MWPRNPLCFHATRSNISWVEFHLCCEEGPIFSPCKCFHSALSLLCISKAPQPSAREEKECAIYSKACQLRFLGHKLATFSSLIHSLTLSLSFFATSISPQSISAFRARSSCQWPSEESDLCWLHEHSPDVHSQRSNASVAQLSHLGEQRDAGLHRGSAVRECCMSTVWADTWDECGVGSKEMRCEL